MKILYTIPNFITAGSGRVLANIAEGLDRAKFEPTVCVSKKGGAIEAELEAMGIPVLEAPFTVAAKPYLGLLGRAKRAAESFKPYGFDLWHSWHYTDDYTEPIIARLAGVKHWVYTKKAMGWGSRAWLLRSLLAKRIIADNFDMPKIFFNQYGMQKKTRVIHHGVNLKEFAVIEVNRQAFRLEHSLPMDAVTVGSVAHLVPVKGHPTLIDAITSLDQAYLLLAGRTTDKEYFNKLLSQVKGLDIGDRVHFLGMVQDVSGFLAQMDIVVLPTWDKWRREGCPVALLEAMACGKACIATDVPGSRDIIEDGASGLLVPPEDPGALAGAIKRLMDDPVLRDRLGAAARQRVVEKFSIEREVAAHERLYLDLMGKAES